MVYRETRTAGQRLSLIDGFRAGAASLVCWHHFALYGPLADWAAPLADDVLATLRDYGRATQVFFVVGGYLLARQTAGLRHRVPIVVRFLSRRAVRLLLPAVAAMGISMTVCAASRDVLPEATVGRPPTARQVAAHVACLQDILGYESLSAGLWYVPIAMQLTMMFAVMVLLDPTTKTVVGSLLAAVSLSMLGADDAWSVWGIYFFAYFFGSSAEFVGKKSTFCRGALRCPLGCGIYSTGIVLSWRLVPEVPGRGRHCRDSGMVAE